VEVKLTEIPETAALGNIRHQIVKNMLAEFPDLKVRISKEINIQGLKLNDNLKNIFSINNQNRQRVNPKRYETGSFSLWSKFSMATTKKVSNSSRYYVFK
jgi:hypothetical protein